MWLLRQINDGINRGYFWLRRKSAIEIMFWLYLFFFVAVPMWEIIFNGIARHNQTSIGLMAYAGLFLR